MNIICTNRNVSNLLCLLLIFMVVPLQLKAQDEYPTPPVIPAMIRQDANRIQHPLALKRFFAKLQSLEKGDSVNVKILHIGDSHIYADMMTGMLRQLFQKRFGVGSTKQFYRYKLAEFQDSLVNSFIVPLPSDSILKKDCVILWPAPMEQNIQPIIRSRSSSKRRHCFNPISLL